MLQPSRVKYRKIMKGNIKGKAHAGTAIAFGEYALQALESARVTARQIEAARRAMTRYVRRGGKVWIRIFPDKSVTKKPAETHMGGGKGSPDHWVAVVKISRILFEMGGVSEGVAKEAMRLAAHKLPISTRFVVKKAALLADSRSEAEK